MSIAQISTTLRSSSHFDNLPLELRGEIYTSYFSSICTIVPPSACIVVPELLQVNNRIGREAFPYFRSCSKFTLIQQETELFQHGPLALAKCSDVLHTTYNFYFPTSPSTTDPNLRVWINQNGCWGSMLTKELARAFVSRWQKKGLDAILQMTFEGYKHLQDPTYPLPPLGPLDFRGYECPYAGPLNVVFDTSHRIAWLCAQGSASQNSIHRLAAGFVAATDAYTLPGGDPLQEDLRPLSREGSHELEVMFRIARQCGYPDEDDDTRVLISPRIAKRVFRSTHPLILSAFGPVDPTAPFSPRLVGNSLGLLLSWALYRTHEVCYYPGHREEMKQEQRPEQNQPGQPFW